MGEWRKEVWKVSIDKSFDACSRKQQRTCAVAKRDVDLGKVCFCYSSVFLRQEQL